MAGFAFGFHLLLSNQDYFALMPNAILKTMLMMLGEYDFADIFLKADGREVLPFPAFTYAMFIFFFALVSILEWEGRGVRLSKLERRVRKEQRKQGETECRRGPRGTGTSFQILKIT